MPNFPSLVFRICRILSAFTRRRSTSCLRSCIPTRLPYVRLATCKFWFNAIFPLFYTKKDFPQKNVHVGTLLHQFMCNTGEKLISWCNWVKFFKFIVATKFLFYIVDWHCYQILKKCFGMYFKFGIRSLCWIRMLKLTPTFGNLSVFPTRTTTSGRKTRPPQHLNDYCLNSGPPLGVILFIWVYTGWHPKKVFIFNMVLWAVVY